MQKLISVSVAAVVLAVLAACGSSQAPVTAGGTDAPGTIATPTGNLPSDVLVLDEGVENDVCGIGVVLKFIPAAATSSTADYAVLMGGPIGNVADQVADHTGADPLPGNAAHLVQGTVETVAGKRFGVNTIDATEHKVMLSLLC